MRHWRPTVGWLPFALVVMAVWMVGQGVMDAEWVEEDMLFLHATLVSALLTAMLARCRISGRWGALILGAVGALYVADGVAHFLPPLFRALWSESGARLATFGQRLASWGVALSSGQSEQNPIAFTFVTGLILWGSAAWALWGILRRGQPLLAMLPLGGTLGISTFLSNERIGFLLGFVVCATLSLPIVHLSRRERRWEREGVDYSLEICLDVWQVAALVAIGVVVLSVVTPSFSIPGLVRSFWELARRPRVMIEDLLVRFFGRVEPRFPPELPGKPDMDKAGGLAEASLPRAHLLGGSPDLSRQLVMYVCTDAPPPVTDDLHLQVLVGLQTYWRGITYDTFGGRDWFNGPSFRTGISAYEPVSASTVTHTASLKQRYLIQAPHGLTLYVVGEPHAVDQPVQSWRRATDDLVGLEGSMDDYVVYSEVPQATARQLESALESYPEHNRYLGVPDLLPERVRILASEITRDADTAYGKAVAIERYLRQFPYDLRVASPPPERDVVDYFLFDAQRGYCDYYASSFVVLARLAGIPARLAVGYAMGEYDPNHGCYRVTEMDAHSWPEVYFPGHGWISFEPTAPFHPFQRPAGSLSQPQALSDVPSVPSRPGYVAAREWWRRVSREWITYAVIAGSVVVLALLIVWGQVRQRRSRLLPAQGIALCYEGLTRMGQWLGVARRPHDTPAEYGAILIAAIRARVAGWPWSGQRFSPVVEEAEDRVLALSQAYGQASYSAHSLDKSYRNQVDHLWHQLRWQLWWLWFASRQKFD